MMFAVISALYYIFIHIGGSEAIINGEDTEPGEFPFIVSLRNETGAHYCGGALITRRHVLTAGHCGYTDDTVFTGFVFEKLPVESIRVTVDSFASSIHCGEKYRVQRMVHHPNYDVLNLNTLHYDIAVITLDEEVKNPRVVPIKRTKEHPAVGSAAITMGWGVKHRSSIESMAVSEILQKLQVTITDSETCDKQVNSDNMNMDFKSMVDEGMLLCAQKDAYSGTCYRDSGSPLVVNGELVGVTVFGLPCAKNASDAYTSVIPHAKFIDEEIKRYETMELLF